MLAGSRVNLIHTVMPPDVNSETKTLVLHYEAPRKKRRTDEPSLLLETLVVGTAVLSEETCRLE